MDAPAWKARLAELLGPLASVPAMRGLRPGGGDLPPSTEALIARLVAAGVHPEVIAENMWSEVVEREVSYQLHGEQGLAPAGLLGPTR
jgi:hypothetical protein